MKPQILTIAILAATAIAAGIGAAHSQPPTQVHTLTPPQEGHERRSHDEHSGITKRLDEIENHLRQIQAKMNLDEARVRR